MKFLHNHSARKEYFVHLYKNKVLKLERKNDEVNIIRRLDLMQRENDWINQLGNMKECYTSFLYVMVQLYGAGIKVFAPSKIDFTALEAMNINLTLEDYNQPFATIVIELPTNYSQSRILKIDPTQTEILTDKSEEELLENLQLNQIPEAVILHFDKETFSLFICVQYQQDYSTMLILNEKEMISNQLASQIPLIKDIMTSAINAALLMDEIGVHAKEPNNPGYLNRLKRFKQNTKDKKKIEKLEAEILSVPIPYALNQVVQLYKKETKIYENNNENDKDSRLMSPHWRRGHYRAQAFGEGRTQRKRIRVPPVFVNSHLLSKDLSETQVTYK